MYKWKYSLKMDSGCWFKRIQCFCQASTDGAKICDVNKCDLNNSIFVTDNVDNFAECNVNNVNNVDHNSVLENNKNFLIL